MIADILKKALKEEDLTKKDVLRLFKIRSCRDIMKLFEAASNIRDDMSKKIKLTSTVHITNICEITPKCKYCGFAAGTSSEGYYYPFVRTDVEILEAVKAIEKSGIPRVSCSGAHGYGGYHAVRAAGIVKTKTSLELLVNVGVDLTWDSLEKLAEYRTDTLCCNLETTNERLFRKLKPGETLKDRINTCNMACDLGLELSSGLLVGIGESHEDRVNHLFFLRNFPTLGEIPIMGFHPYKGTSMENHPQCSMIDQTKTIAITRLLYRDLRITAPTPTIGPESAQSALLAGADNLATVIPEDYPLNIKGVGSPTFGNLKDVLRCIRELGLKPQISK